MEFEEAVFVFLILKLNTFKDLSLTLAHFLQSESIQLASVLLHTCGASLPLCKSSPGRAAPGWLWTCGWPAWSTGAPPSASAHLSSLLGSAAPGNTRSRNSSVRIYSMYTHPPLTCPHNHKLTLHSIRCFPLMDGVMLSYLSQPGGTVPLPVGLQVAASIRRLVNQTQQLYSLWRTA